MLVVALFGILAVAVWYAAHAWMSVDGPPMPASGYVAMTLGVVFSLLVGFALMALMFYSSRHGYDDARRPAAARADDGATEAALSRPVARLNAALDLSSVSGP